MTDTYALPSPDGDPDLGLPEFSSLFVEEAPGDVVLDSDLLAVVRQGSVLFRRIAVTDEGYELTDLPQYTVALPTAPLDYDAQAFGAGADIPWAQPSGANSGAGSLPRPGIVDPVTVREGSPAVSCLISWYDSEGDVWAVHIVIQRDNDGALGAQRANFRRCPQLDTDDTMYPRHVYGSYDAWRNVMLVAIGYSDDEVIFEGETTLVTRWRDTMSTLRAGSEATPASGSVDIIEVAAHANLYPTGVLRADGNVFLITTVNGGNVRPLSSPTPSEPGDATSRIYTAVGLGLDHTTVDGFLGRGFIYIDEEEDWHAYLPHATHDADETSDVTLLHLSGGVLTPVYAHDEDGEVTEDPLLLATITGDANWRPTGLHCQRFREPQPLDPTGYNPTLGITWDDLLSLLAYGIDAEVLLQILLPPEYDSPKIVATLSVPDQPPDADNPRAFPSSMVLVDLNAQLTTDIGVVGPAVIGDRRSIGAGDVKRLVSHPAGITWAVLAQYDTEAEEEEA